jgi:hypothetical protein
MYILTWFFVKCFVYIPFLKPPTGSVSKNNKDCRNVILLCRIWLSVFDDTAIADWNHCHTNKYFKYEALRF